MKHDKISESHLAILEDIGRVLKRLRKEKKVGYIEAAEEIGIDRNTLNYMENGKSSFKFINLLMVLDYYDISLQDLFSEISKNKT